MNWTETITKIPIYTYQTSSDGNLYVYVYK